MYGNTTFSKTSQNRLEKEGNTTTMNVATNRSANFVSVAEMTDRICRRVDSIKIVLIYGFSVLQIRKYAAEKGRGPATEGRSSVAAVPMTDLMVGIA